MESSTTLPAKSRLVDVSALSDRERRALLARAHALEGRIFRSVEPFDVYATRVLDAGAREVWAWILEDRGGNLVGYNVILYHEREYRGQSIGVYNANVGLLPEYRGHNRTVATGLRLAIPRLLREPRRRLYFHAYLLHPSVYVMLDKYATTLWPSARSHPPPPEALDLLAWLGSRTGAPPAWEPDNPWVVRLATAIDEGDAEMASWRCSNRPSVRYFFDKNPHYREGGALALLVPLTLDNLGRAAARLALGRWNGGRR